MTNNDVILPKSEASKGEPVSELSSADNESELLEELSAEEREIQTTLEGLGEEVSQEELEIIMQFQFASQSPDFPASCLRRKDEPAKYYGHFIAYLLLGFERTLIKAVNAIQPKGSPRIYSDMKSPEARAQNIKNGNSPNKISAKYVKVCIKARRFEWRQRAVDYDNYVAKFMLRQTGFNINRLGMDALNILDEQMRTAKSGTTRVLAAKAIIDKALPNITTNNVNIAADIRTSRQLTDQELMQLAGGQKQLNEPAIDADYTELPVVRPRQSEQEEIPDGVDKYLEDISMDALKEQFSENGNGD